VSDALEKFFNEWPKGWHEGYSIGDSSSNIGLEANYRLLKEDELNNSHLEALEFLNKLKLDIVKTWSTSRNTNNFVVGNKDDKDELDNGQINSFCNEPNIDKKEWLNAYQWYLLKKKFIKFELDNEIVLCVANDNKTEINTTMCIEFFDHLENCYSDNFDDFMAKILSVSYIKFNEDNWKLSVCSCNSWSKNFICCHVIYVAVKERLAFYPEIAKDLPISKKGKRGRPPLNANALLQQQSEQPDEFYYNNKKCYAFASQSYSDL
jgi:hypothetical protein